jgi:hypothetical protein
MESATKTYASDNQEATIGGVTVGKPVVRMCKNIECLMCYDPKFKVCPHCGLPHRKGVVRCG